jgi:hypothetical protein
MATKRPKTKWRFAIGTTSLVPGSKLHYLIVDIDSKYNGEIVNLLWYIIQNFPRCSIYIQATRHGYHLFTNVKMHWRTLRRELRRMPNVDPSWITIGERRGYFFLADKKPVRLSWPVKRMTLRWEKNMGRRKN